MFNWDMYQPLLVISAQIIIYIHIYLQRYIYRYIYIYTPLLVDDYKLIQQCFNSWVY